jgi:hypothetical protein
MVHSCDVQITLDSSSNHCKLSHIFKGTFGCYLSYKPVLVLRTERYCSHTSFQMLGVHILASEAGAEPDTSILHFYLAAAEQATNRLGTDLLCSVLIGTAWLLVFFRRVRKIEKSECSLHHACLSVCVEQLGGGIFM